MTALIRGAFLDLEFINSHHNCGNNSDKFTIKLRADGQPIKVGGVEVDELSFDIIGPLELSDFINAVRQIEHYR